MKKGAVQTRIQGQLRNLPDSPGVYRFFNDKGVVIYVGKAKNLKKRVSSYFNQKSSSSYKTHLLVSKIFDIQCIVVENEADSLLLENNLIKELQPHYNILLKDDKTFPWIVIKNESFPRVFYTRNTIKDGSEYFGPYTSVMMVKTLLDLIKSLFHIRTCKLNLSENLIKQNKYKVCLEYHIGNCKGPCVGKQKSDDYLRELEDVRNIVKGNLQTVNNHLKKMMADYAENLDFENANIVKDKIEILKKYQSKSTIVNPKLTNIDVFSIEAQNNEFYINYINVHKGAVIQSHNMEIVPKIEEEIEDVLLSCITNIRERLNSQAREVLVPFQIDNYNSNYKCIVPKIGDKLHLLELSKRNLKQFVLDKNLQKLKNKNESRTNKLLLQIKEDFRLTELPVRIECFDNSNIQGSNPVAACVVFENGKPRKKEYRHFHVKTVEGPDDFASMREIIYRRYKRQVEEKNQLPQLIVIDGGKGQLSSAVESIKKLGLEKTIPVIGIAKKLEEIYFPGDKYPVYIDKNSPTLKVIQNLRNEAHRFGITFHRNTRSKDMTKSELDNIKGIGVKTKELLLKKYKSITQIKKADREEIVKLIGNKKEAILHDYFVAMKNNKQ